MPATRTCAPAKRCDRSEVLRSRPWAAPTPASLIEARPRAECATPQPAPCAGRQAHQHMRDAGLGELVALGDEAGRLVKAARAGLRVQVQIAHAQAPRQPHRGQQQIAPHALPARAAQHRQPADVGIGQHPCAAHRQAGAIARQQMPGAVVAAVDLQRLRYALFVDEHRAADRQQLGGMLRPADLGDGVGRHRGIGVGV